MRCQRLAECRSGLASDQSPFQRPLGPERAGAPGLMNHRFLVKEVISRKW